jgi:hypothetical protein
VSGRRLKDTGEEHATSTFSLRLADDDYRALRAVALLTGQHMAAIVRAAIDEAVQKFAQKAKRGLLQPDELTGRRHALAVLEERAVAADTGLLTGADSALLAPARARPQPR